MTDEPAAAPGRTDGKAPASRGTGVDGVRTRSQRRAFRTRTSIEDAYVALVLERGVEKVTVEQVADRADVAKATFYAHFDNKEAVLGAVFARLTRELGERVAYTEGPWTEVRHGAITAVLQHAREMSGLYRVCMADAHMRDLYLKGFCEFAERNMRDRLAGLGGEPRVPVPVMARAFAGAHVALLEAWLDGDITGTAEEVATFELATLVGGLAWAHHLSPSAVGLTDG